VYTPEVLAQIYENNWEFKAPNGESQKDVEERIYEWVDTNLIQTSFMGKVGLVTHGMTIKSFFRKIMSSDARMTYKIKIENTSITQFNYTPAKGWTLERLNDFKP
jgi:probable phosphoglycerate mutase